MLKLPAHSKDPLLWCWGIAIAYLVLVWVNLAIPSKPYFDEVHYVPAARSLLALKQANPEHPLLGKEAIAATIWLFDDFSLVWRIPSALMGTVGLFAFGRMLWWGTRRRFATLAGMVLLASDFAWFIQSRIAMLDMVMAGFAMLALWQVTAALAVRRPRWRLAVAGMAFGLAMAAKWSVVPVIVLTGLVLFISLWRKPRVLTGISLIELPLWIGLLPLLVYAISFTPAFFYTDNPLSPFGLVQWHHTMIALQDSVTKTHPYQSQWWQWVINWRAIWYLYEVTDGAQRGVLLIGNPLTMLAGLPALGWCVWRRHWSGVMLVGLYAVSLGMWAISGKPVQFYYHYLLPSTFLMAMLALMLDDLWRCKGARRWLAPVVLAGSVALFIWFYPILSSAPLQHGHASFEHWMWLNSWR